MADAVFAVLFDGLDLASLQINEAYSTVSLILGLVLLPRVVCFVGSGLLFLRWLYRCIEHEQSLDSRGFRNKPFDIVVAYVLPFVSLVRPCRIIAHLYRVSDPSELPVPPPREVAAQDYREAPVLISRDNEAWRHAFPLNAWWVMRLVDLTFSRVAFALPELPLSPVKLGEAFRLHTISAVASVAQVVLFLFVVRALEARRDERYRRLLAMTRK